MGGVKDGAEGASAPVWPSVLTALRQAPLGVAIFDRDMRYLAASGRFLTDQGLPGDTPLAGRRHYDVFPDIPQKWRDVHARVLADGAELSHDADPYALADGRTEWIRWSVSPWRTDAGEVGGLVLYTEVVTAQVEARLRLEAAEAHYRAVFDKAAAGVARVSPQGVFLEVNDPFCAIAQRPRAAIVGSTFQEITHPDDIEGDLVQVRTLLAGDAESYAMEKRYLGPDGEVIWVHLTVSLVRVSGEPAYFIAVIEDIGLRKAAEALQQTYQDQLRLLINELNHRVKNTLATVQSMAAQTMRHAADPLVAYAAFEARLMGLAEVNAILTREKWNGAALAEVAQRALTPFLGADLHRRVRIEGPEVWLNPAGALTMALVFHELATNAVKYGALAAESGRVDLVWSLAAPEQLRLGWRESGGPPVSPPTRKGFGSRLIERGLRGDMRGSVTMAYEPAGLRCDMEAVVPPPLRLEGL